MGLIFHVDMDAFFVSVEELFDPSLRGKPVVVGGKPGERGAVSAASYAARRFGIHSAMPLRRAYELCPEAIFLEGRLDQYRIYSRKVREVFMSMTPALTMMSIDEAYLDMSGTERLHGKPLAAAHKLHEEVKARTGLNCSIGIAGSRLAAKVASDQAKPNGVLWIPAGMEGAFLGPLAVRKLPGVGAKTEGALQAIGIRRVADLARVGDEFLEERFGAWGPALAGKARGEDAGGWYDEAIGAGSDPKSISHEHTFGEDTRDEERVVATLAKLCEMVARRLRTQGLHARTLQLKLRNSKFETMTRARSLPHGTQLDGEMFEELKRLLEENWDGWAVRLIGVQAGGLQRLHGQMNLLDGGRSERWRKVLDAADRMRDKFGDDSVGLGRALKGKFRERAHEALPEDGGENA
jgi:DNA polymerase-4